jgi:hypothetical protein
LAVKDNKMKVSVEFTKKELELLKKALLFGITHNENNKEANEMNKIDAKLNLLCALANER